MLLKFVHETRMSYAEPITESVVELRMAPRQARDQHRLSFMLALGPRTQVSSYFDWLGNTVHTFTINPAHREIQIVATSIIETDRPLLDVTELGDLWFSNPPKPNYQMWDYLQFGGPVVDSPLLREVVEKLYPHDNLPLGELAMRMLFLINTSFQYEKGVTQAFSPITEALEHRKGVCQDFTHLMIGMARALGIPARYISGLVHPENSGYRGFTQTHAWCELYFPSYGWIAFDPTNCCVVGANFIQVAIGRDYRDVAPNRGVYRGASKEAIDVVVKSEVLDAIPSDLFAERFQSLPVAVTLSSTPKTFAIQSQHQQETQQQQ